jgi:hypothetical protein
MRDPRHIVCCLVLVFALFAVNGPCFAQCNCGAEYVIVHDGGQPRMIGSANFGGNYDTYANFSDYGRAYNYMSEVSSWGYSVNYIVAAADCNNRSGDPCRDEF